MSQHQLTPRERHNAAIPAHGRPTPLLAPRVQQAYRISTDAEALQVARQLAADFAAQSAERDRERRLPIDEIERFSQSGLWSISVPRAYGGPGLSTVTLAEVIAIISSADASIGQIPQNHFYMIEALRLAGSEEQKQSYFKRIIDGDRLGNAFSEVGTRHAADFRTTITRTGDTFVLHGQKFYSTGALFAHVIPVVAADEAKRAQIVFLERDTRGLTIIDDWSSFGQRTTGSGSTVFDNIAVEPFQIVPHEDVFDQPTPMGPLGQILHAAVDVGIARGALVDTIAFVRKYARPWIDTPYERGTDDPHLIHAIGELAIKVDAANALLERGSQSIDAATAESTADRVAEASIAVAEAKALAAETALAVTSKLFELAGARSTLAEFGLDRHWRNARTHTLHDPVRWKYHRIGDFFLNGTKPPRNGAI